ncbi:MAG: hypothetical protein P8L78_17775 [Mariniblastus sp.]|nr:hypothetical protein [Mariniblastus sp.]
MTRHKYLRHLSFCQLSDSRCQQASRLAPHRRMICCKYAATNWKYAATLAQLGSGFSASLDQLASSEYPLPGLPDRCACTASSSSRRSDEPVAEQQQGMCHS